MIHMLHVRTGETALLQKLPRGLCLAQFDRFDHPESHGWHLHLRKEFRRIPSSWNVPLREGDYLAKIFEAHSQKLLEKLQNQREHDQMRAILGLTFDFTPTARTPPPPETQEFPR